MFDELGIIGCVFAIRLLQPRSGCGRGEIVRALRQPSDVSLQLGRLQRSWEELGEVWRFDAAVDNAQRQVLAARAMSIDVLVPWDFPEWVAVLPDPPFCLCVRGDSRVVARSAVAIVGSRRCTTAAADWAFSRAAEVAAEGMVVVSGGARGVDAAAHRGALSADGTTAVYLGVAADRTYPSGNRALFAEIMGKGGALISEHPPASTTRAFDHARRNRLIAAHGEALLVASAGERSGTLGTARVAKRLGKPVYVSDVATGESLVGIEQLLAEKTATTWDLGNYQPRVPLLGI